MFDGKPAVVVTDGAHRASDPFRSVARRRSKRAVEPYDFDVGWPSPERRKRDVARFESAEDGIRRGPELVGAEHERVVAALESRREARARGRAHADAGGHAGGGRRRAPATAPRR